MTSTSSRPERMVFAPNTKQGDLAIRICETIRDYGGSISRLELMTLLGIKSPEDVQLFSVVSSKITRARPLLIEKRPGHDPLNPTYALVRAIPSAILVVPTERKVHRDEPVATPAPAPAAIGPSEDSPAALVQWAMGLTPERRAIIVKTFAFVESLK